MAYQLVLKSSVLPHFYDLRGNNMRSFIGTRVKVINNGAEKIGMVSSVKGDTIYINIGATEVIEAPLDDAEIMKADEEMLDFIIQF